MSWWTALIVALALLVSVYLVLAFEGALAMNLTARSLSEAARHGASSPINLAIAQLAGGFLVLAFATRKYELGWKRYEARLTILLIAFGIALQFVLAEVGNTVSAFIPQANDQSILLHHWLNSNDPLFVLQVFIAFVVVAPLIEELIFRGALLRGLGKSYGTPLALLLSTLLFALVHAQPRAIVYAGVGGLFLGLIALWTNSTKASFVVHAAINATGVLLPEKLLRIEGFNTLSESPAHIAAPLLIVSVSLCLLFLYLLYKLTRDNSKRARPQ